jgi:hypothetical protein
MTPPNPLDHIDLAVADQVDDMLTGRPSPGAGAPFFDDDGCFLGPEEAAAHAILVQGGFTTPEIEAERMIRDGGVSAERARAWLAEQPTAD